MKLDPFTPFTVMVQKPLFPIPKIVCPHASKEDQDQIWLLNNALENVEIQMQKFFWAVRLFEYCAMQNLVLGMPSRAFTSWQFIASRDGVMSISHFRKEMETVNYVANRLALIAPYLDKPVLSSAHRKWEERFQGFEKLRHAVAHAGEMARTQSSFEEHMGEYASPYLNPDGGKISIQDTLEGWTYICTIEGKTYRCEMTETTVASLRDIMATYFAAFAKVPVPIPPAPPN